MSIEVNSIVEGKVVKIKPFGAIVLIDNKVQGLVHISHISLNYVKDINDHISVGDAVTVKVLSIDPENGKVSLSIKDANPNPTPAKTFNNDRPPRFEKSYNNNNNHRSNNNNYSSNKEPLDSGAVLEEKIKEWLKTSNERHAGLNKRNKRK